MLCMDLACHAASTTPKYESAPVQSIWSCELPDAFRSCAAEQYLVRHAIWTLTTAVVFVQTEGLSVDDMHTLKPPFDYLLTSEERVPG